MDTICQDNGRTADALFKNFLSPDWAAPALQVTIHNALGQDQWQSIQGVIAEVKDVLVQLLDEVKRSVAIDVGAQMIQLASPASCESRVRLTCPVDFVSFV